jgi:hypothetical protein
VLAYFHVVVKMYRYSLEERVFIAKAYWISGSIKNCQRRFVEQFGGRNPPSKRCIQLLVKKLILSYLIFSCYQLPFSEFPKHTTALHYRYDMQMYCTFVLFVNQHFPGLPATGTHCIISDAIIIAVPPMTSRISNEMRWGQWSGLAHSIVRQHAASP